MELNKKTQAQLELALSRVDEYHSLFQESLELTQRQQELLIDHEPEPEPETEPESEPEPVEVVVEVEDGLDAPLHLQDLQPSLSQPVVEVEEVEEGLRQGLRYHFSQSPSSSSSVNDRILVTLERHQNQFRSLATSLTRSFSAAASEACSLSVAQIRALLKKWKVSAAREDVDLVVKHFQIHKVDLRCFACIILACALRSSPSLRVSLDRSITSVHLIYMLHSTCPLVQTVGDTNR